MRMKKIITLLLALAGMVSTASAYDNIYFVSNMNSYSRSSDMFTYQYHKDATNEDVFTYNIDASSISSTDKIYFRMYISGWGNEISPYKDADYTFSFADGSKTSETTGSKYEREYYQRSNVAFCINHPNILASKYKVTIYRGFNNTNYENEDCKVMWVTVDIEEMPVTIGSTGKATYYGNRALNFSGTGITAYTITGATKATGALTAAAQTSVPANTGLYLEGAATTYNVPVIANFDASGDEDITGNMLKGSVTQIDDLPQEDGSYTNYILTVNTKDYGNVATPKFYKVNSGGNILLANKAYLQILTANAARDFFWFEDESTGVDATLTDSNSVKGEVFDLQGRRVAQPTKGLYIVNGKKVLY